MVIDIKPYGMMMGNPFSNIMGFAIGLGGGGGFLIGGDRLITCGGGGFG
jgi:hypothetical protein